MKKRMAKKVFSTCEICWYEDSANPYRPHKGNDRWRLRLKIGKKAGIVFTRRQLNRILIPLPELRACEMRVLHKKELKNKLKDPKYWEDLELTRQQMLSGVDD